MIRFYLNLTTSALILYTNSVLIYLNGNGYINHVLYKKFNNFVIDLYTNDSKWINLDD